MWLESNGVAADDDEDDEFAVADLANKNKVFETYWSADGSSGDDADQRMVTEETRLNHESIRPPLGLLRIQLPHMHALH